MGERPTIYKEIVDYIEGGINAGRFDTSRRLPSDMELARKFDTSRPTVVRAMLDLQGRGIIERRTGSGTYIRSAPAERTATRGATVGLIVAGLGNTEILDPICAELGHSAESKGYIVLRGDAKLAEPGASDYSPQQARALAANYVSRNVDGVFFAPLELPDDRNAVNQEIVEALASAGIAVVLLDRDIVEFPGRSDYDIVGIDNFTAGYLLGDHVACQGYREVRFTARPSYPATTDLRLAGVREALLRHGLPGARLGPHVGDPGDPGFVESLVGDGGADAVICSNDRTAAMLMQTLSVLGVRVPDAMAVAGFDDVRYATLLSVPLTTMRQPCRDIGVAAVELMADRLAERKRTTRSVQLPAQLVVRASTSGPRLPRNQV